MSQFGNNLRRLMARIGLTVDQVVERSGLDKRTVGGILAQSKVPHARTLHRLAEGLGVSADEFFQDSSLKMIRQFDRETNPAIEEAVAAHPEWFHGWDEADLDELASRFGTGGALLDEAIRDTVEMMNRNRDVHRQVALVLESSEADFLTDLVRLLYHKISVDEDKNQLG